MSIFSETSAILLFALLIEIAGLVVVVLADPYVERQHRIVMIIIAAAVFALIVQDYTEYAFDMAGNNHIGRLIASIVGYCLRPLIVLLFFYIVDTRREFWRAWVLVIINTVIHLSALFSDVCFTITKDNRFVRGPMGYSCHIISAVLIVQLIYFSAKGFDKKGGVEKFIPSINALLIVLSVLADTFFSSGDAPLSFLTAAVVGCSLLYYVWMHLQFVHRHEMAMQAEQRIQIMISQIQPHFLFNTLSTIQALCLIDSKKAADTVEKLGAYLRQNLESLNQSDCIPFEKELEHVQLYTAIEMIRFPSIVVEFRIDDDDFAIPALSVQPMVENAIRHGVRVRGEGLVTVRSWRDIDAHVITITDNGVGFDVEAAKHAEGTHIGIKNVTERIEKMCHGTVDIKSSKGEGTSITIKIPA